MQEAIVSEKDDIQTVATHSTHSNIIKWKPGNNNV